MPTFNGAELLIRLLERQNVRTVAGIPGGANLPIYQALGQSRQIRHILCRHEQAAGFVAQGMARVTGQPGVCMATSGPGATNLLTAVADAKLDSIPLVAITGQVPTTMIGTDAFQEVDTYGMSIPVTKHNYLIRDAQELLTVVPEAFTIAASGRPGPVWIDIPKNVQQQSLAIDMLPEPGGRQPESAAEMEAIQQAAERINQAQRPLLMFGGGLIHANACQWARRLAEKADAPVVSTLMALGAMASDHPLHLGMLGMHGSQLANRALQACDLLIVLGARLDDRATGLVEQFCPQAEMIHVDIDASEMGKIRQPQIAVRGDLAHVLDRLVGRIRLQKRADWLAQVRAIAECYPMHRSDPNDLFMPDALIGRIAQQLGDQAVVCTDVGQHQMWAAQYYPFKHPRRWLTSGGLGTMGFGLPAAIGAALALQQMPGREQTPVVCFTGDGSLLMNLQELVVCAETGVDLKIILFNNQSLGLVCQQQRLFYGDDQFGSRFQVNPAFTTIAQGLGVRAFDLAEADDPGAMLRFALGERGPVLIHVPIDAEHQVYPMVRPGAGNHEMIDRHAGHNGGQTL